MGWLWHIVAWGRKARRIPGKRYAQRGADALPRSGNRAPWVGTADYKYGRRELLEGPLTAEMLFGKAAAVVERVLEAAE